MSNSRARRIIRCYAARRRITSIDPIRHELLFERFVSGERKEPPDIDVDFEHERREEIIQWIYDTYGLALEEVLVETAAAAAMAHEPTNTTPPFRQPLPGHLPRDDVVHAPACVCPGCGGALRPFGEDVT